MEGGLEGGREGGREGRKEGRKELTLLACTITVRPSNLHCGPEEKNNNNNEKVM